MGVNFGLGTPGGRLAARLVRGLAIGVAAVWGTWLIVLHLFVWTPLLRTIINAHEPGIHVAWSFAWSLVPERVHFRNLVVSGQTNGQQFEVRFDDVLVAVALQDLPRRIFHATAVHGEGLAFSIRGRRLAWEWDGDPRHELPGIEPFMRAPLAEYGPDDRVPDWRYANFSVWLEDIQVPSLRRLWIDRLRVEGEGTVGGAFYLKPGRELLIAPGLVTFSHADVFTGPDKVASKLSLDIGAQIDSLDPREVNFAGFMRRVDATVKLQADLDARLLDVFTDAPGLGGNAALGLIARVQAGQLLPGSSLLLRGAALQGGDLAARTLDLEISVPEAAPVVARARLDAGDARGPGSVRLGKLHVEADLEQPDLAQPEWPQRAVLHAEQGAFRGPVLAPLLHVPADVLHGDGTFSLHLAGPARRLAGRARVAVQGVRLRRGVTTVEGNAAVDVAVRALDPLTGADLAGTRVRVDGAHLVDGGESDAKLGWWADATLKVAQLRKDGLDAEVNARCRDARPIVGLYVRRSSLPGFLAGLFAMDDLSVHGSVLVRPGELGLRDLTASGDGAFIRGVWHRKGAATKGAAVLSWRGLSAGIDLGDGGSSVVPFAGNGWFEQRAAGLQPGHKLGPLPQARAVKAKRKVVPVQGPD